MQDNKELTRICHSELDSESINVDLNQKAGFFRLRLRMTFWRVLDNQIECLRHLRMTPRLARVASLRGATRRRQGDPYSKAPAQLGIQASNPVDRKEGHEDAGSSLLPKMGCKGSKRDTSFASLYSEAKPSVEGVAERRMRVKRVVIPAYEPESINANLNQKAGFFRPDGLRMTYWNVIARLSRSNPANASLAKDSAEQMINYHLREVGTALAVEGLINAKPHSHSANSRKAAFTLAEVLITLGIIGVVAAMTMPTLIGIGKQHAWEKQKLVFEQKFREATAQMKVADALSGHTTTEAFVAELSKYMKFAKKCDNSNIQNCYAPKIILGAEDSKEVNTLTTSAKLGREAYNTNTMGLVVLDGVSVIIAYDPKCDPIDPSDNTKDTLACLSIVYDVNGRNTPNKIGMDIVTINATITTCDIKIGDLCTTGGDIPFTPISEAPCRNNNNEWAGAREACAALNMRLPTPAELAKIASYQYGTTIGADENKYGLTIDPKSKANLYGWYWSSEERGNYGFERVFNINYSSSSAYDKNNDGGKVRCVK